MNRNMLLKKGSIPRPGSQNCNSHDSGVDLPQTTQLAGPRSHEIREDTNPASNTKCKKTEAHWTQTLLDVSYAKQHRLDRLSVTGTGWLSAFYTIRLGFPSEGVENMKKGRGAQTSRPSRPIQYDTGGGIGSHQTMDMEKVTRYRPLCCF